MMRDFKKFISREDGAVTVDWVVLTAVIVGFGAIILLNLIDPIRHVDTQTGNALSAIDVVDLNFESGGD